MSTDAARDCCFAIRELVVRHPGGTSSEATAAAVRKLCRIAAHEADDERCAGLLRRVEDHAAELFSGCGSGNWVRRELLRSLEDFRARLYEIETSGDVTVS
jgi:hypothetical protein